MRLQQLTFSVSLTILVAVPFTESALPIASFWSCLHQGEPSSNLPVCAPLVAAGTGLRLLELVQWCGHSPRPTTAAANMTPVFCPHHPETVIWPVRNSNVPSP